MMNFIFGLFASFLVAVLVIFSANLLVNLVKKIANDRAQNEFIWSQRDALDDYNYENEEAKK